MAAAAAGEQGPGGAELLKLAAAQRMSTDARRAAFCVIMGSEDYVDASERLLRLPLKVGPYQDPACAFTQSRCKCLVFTVAAVMTLRVRLDCCCKCLMFTMVALCALLCG